jgi:hypothetical protein
MWPTLLLRWRRAGDIVLVVVVVVVLPVLIAAPSLSVRGVKAMLKTLIVSVSYVSVLSA